MNKIRNQKNKLFFGLFALLSMGSLFASTGDNKAQTSKLNNTQNLNKQNLNNNNNNVIKDNNKKKIQPKAKAKTEAVVDDGSNVSKPNNKVNGNGNENLQPQQNLENDDLVNEIEIDKSKVTDNQNKNKVKDNNNVPTKEVDPDEERTFFQKYNKTLLITGLVGGAVLTVGGTLLFRSSNTNSAGNVA